MIVVVLSRSELIALSNAAVFAIVLMLVGLALVLGGLALPGVAGVQEVCGCRTITIPSGRIDPNPLQLPLLVVGGAVLASGFGLLALQFFRR